MLERVAQPHDLWAGEFPRFINALPGLLPSVAFSVGRAILTGYADSSLGSNVFRSSIRESPTPLPPSPYPRPARAQALGSRQQSANRVVRSLLRLRASSRVRLPGGAGRWIRQWRDRARRSSDDAHVDKLIAFPRLTIRVTAGGQCDSDDHEDDFVFHGSSPSSPSIFPARASTMA